MARRNYKPDKRFPKDEWSSFKSASKPYSLLPTRRNLRAHQFFRFWACALLFWNCAKRKSAIRQEVEPLSTFKRKNGKVSEANVHLEGTDLAIILRQLIENSGVGVRSGTSFRVGSTEEGEVMAVSINEERKTPPNNGEECPGQVDNNFDREVFIEEIGSLPCLWNTSIADYRDRERL